MFNFLFYKCVIQEASTWKEEVIDFQDPYATKDCSCSEISFYPMKWILSFLILLLLLYFTGCNC